MAKDLINLNAEDGRDIITDSAAPGLNIVQSGTGEGLGIDGSSTGDGVSIDQSSTGIGADISVATGDGVEVDGTGTLLDLNAKDTTGAYEAVNITTANYSHPSVGMVTLTNSCASGCYLEFTGLGVVSTASLFKLAAPTLAAIRVAVSGPGGRVFGWLPVLTNTTAG